MKKLILTLAMALIPGAVFAGSQVNTLYTHAVSTKAITDASGTADINLAAVKVKSIDIANHSATAQTITVYKNGSSTTTIEAVYVYQLPATVGQYSVPLFSSQANIWASNADYVDIPYCTVRASSSTANLVTVDIKYWK